MSPQNRRLLDYFQRWGSITPRQAWNDLSIYRLSARIKNLREAGHAIETQRIEVRDRFGTITRPARYVYNGSQGTGGCLTSAAG